VYFTHGFSFQWAKTAHFGHMSVSKWTLNCI
jgi:hypothetical protein